MRFNSLAAEANHAAAQDPLSDVNVAGRVDGEAVWAVERTGTKERANGHPVGADGVGPIWTRHRVAAVTDPFDDAILPVEDRQACFQLGNHQLRAADREPARR